MTLRLSKEKPQPTFKRSESIQLPICIYTGLPAIPTSKNAITTNTDVIPKDEIVIVDAPVLPNFLPSNPDTAEANKGKNKIVKYMFKFLMICYLLIDSMQQE